jgi:formate hydrogenlyase transcriptional activator
MVDEQKFRADVFYCLSIFPIPLPSLRDRREDVPLLIRHFINEYAQRMNKRINVIPRGGHGRNAALLLAGKYS